VYRAVSRSLIRIIGIMCRTTSHNRESVPPLQRQAGLQVGFEKLGLGFDVLSQVFLGGTGITRTRWNFRPSGTRWE
jgi:hypothetical protein